MTILLDSHAFVWFVRGDRRCSMVAREAIEQPGLTVYVSPVTAWEVATKVRLGKWPEAVAVVREFHAILLRLFFTPLPISIEHGRVAGSLPGPHKDPFDRMLAAQAQLENLTLVTADRAFETFGTRTLW